MPIRAVTDNVAEKLKKLPKSPGCYIYKDDKGEVLYVGKAVVLRNRVRSYFQTSSRHSIRIERLVSKIRDIEWIVVDSELEALVLECNLIKQHRPPYNVRLRDDKSYPYIVITKEAFPRVMFTRKVRKDGGQYFGPYTSSYNVRDTLQLLHKVFPLIPCGKSWTGEEEQRPCLYYHLKRCLAPCAGMADKKEYAEVIGQVSQVLRGKEDSLIEDLKTKMEKAAEDLDFEKAAQFRDQVYAIEHTLQRQKVVNADGTDQDVIAVVKDERGAAIQMLYIRNGKLIGQNQYMLDGAADAPPGEAVQEFVKQYYSNSPEVPKEILLPVEIDEINIVQSWLRQKRGSAVTLEVPRGGEKLRMLEMAANNAELALNAMSQELAAKESWAEEALAQLQEELELPSLPYRIEGYDISNIQGTAPVGSMVVTENGEAAKAEYRRFKIKFLQETPNDFAMMNEVIMRRLRNYLDGNEKFTTLPDLFMIDGGKGQLGAALKARDDLGLSVPMVGLAKKQEIVFVPTHKNLDGSYSFREVVLPLTAPGLMLLRKLRDEAHRFALTFHRKIRDKRMNGSILDEVPGIGPRRRRLLLRTFGSVEGIRRASVEEIASVPTLTRAVAEKIKEYLVET
ncbi:MAG: excinuclease ABC subunit UvrC [Armatimonadetes bacterium]|nr:excinuclease ABC subunit UvrC [Armatimonadota bacterium]